MKKLITVVISLFLFACSGEQIEELAFRKTIEYNLAELCGDDDKACINAVKSQVKGCMEQSDWRTFVKQQDDPNALDKFAREFYPCIVDVNGSPYFVSNE